MHLREQKRLAKAISIIEYLATTPSAPVWQPGNTPDSVQTYDEIEAPKGSLGLLKGSDLMDLLLARL